MTTLPRRPASRRLVPGRTAFAAMLARLGIAAVGVAGLIGVAPVAFGAETAAARSGSVPTGALPVGPGEAAVVLYGDSLAWEARDHFREALVARGVGRVHTATFGGTAICDWLDEMRADALALRPTAVVVEFSGNAFTPCMRDERGQGLTRGSGAYYQKYSADAEQVVRIFAATGTRVYFAGAPTSRRSEETHDPHTGRLNALYAALQGRYPNVAFVDSGTAVLRDGRFTPTLPCLPAEICTGGIDANARAVNQVRSPDGVHFCPTPIESWSDASGGCTVWSSGAYRYGAALAAPVLRDLAAPEPAAEGGVLLVGDSILAQPSEAIVESLARVGVRAHPEAVSGSGLLSGAVDWQASARDLVDRIRPEVVLVLFVGNFGPNRPGDQMYARDGELPRDEHGDSIVVDTPQFFAAWQNAAARLTRTLQSRGAVVYWVEPPPMHPIAALRRAPELYDGYRRLHDANPAVRYLSPGSAVAGPDGNWVPSMITCGDHRDVRAPDTVHFSADGARRFGQTLAALLATDRGWNFVPSPC